jgi:hypothetical protein
VAADHILHLRALAVGVIQLLPVQVVAVEVLLRVAAAEVVVDGAGNRDQIPVKISKLIIYEKKNHHIHTYLLFSEFNHCADC